jgi:DUF4097 and DUF4098 domain-containing protein YvlB
MNAGSARFIRRVSGNEELSKSLLRKGVRPMMDAGSHPRVSALLVAAVPILSLLTAAQEKKEFRYTVGPKAIVSITNNYGAITVKPSGNNQVVATTVSYSDAVTFENEQRGNRIEFRASSGRQGSNLADYTVVVPADAFVSVRSSDGKVHAQGLHGDVVLEGATGTVEATDINSAHLHVKTLSGQVSLTDIRDSHVDVHSVSGNVDIRNVSGSSLEVNSGSGRIRYEGDPGSAGEYLFTTHSGDLEVSIPTSAPVEIKAHSLKGESDQGLPSAGGLSAAGQNSLLKPGIMNASRFVLRSFRGRIHVKRP